MISNEIRFEIYKRDGYICRHPRCYSTEIQLAHGIAKTKSNVKMVKSLYMELFKKDISEEESLQIINSPENLYSSCAKHNSVFNFGFKRELVKLFLQKYEEKTTQAGG